MFKTIKVLYNNQRLRRSIAGRDLSLLYHFVGSTVPKSGKFHAVTTQQFIHQVRSLKKRWRFTGEEEFFSAREDRYPRILLTFDDGYKQTLNEVSNFLAAEEIPFIFFVNADLLQGGYLWRDKVRVLIDGGYVKEFIDRYQLPYTETSFYEASKDPRQTDPVQISRLLDKFIEEKGIELQGFDDLYCTAEDIKQHLDNNYMKVGNHSFHHYCMSALPLHKQEEEVMACQRYLVQQFGKEKVSSLFSVPFGSYQSFNADTLDVLKRNDFKAVMATEGNAYFKQHADLTTNDTGFAGYKRLLPKSSYRF